MRCGLLVIASALTLTASALTPAARSAAAPRATVVVELFTSEGCSSCPPADALLQRLADASSESGPDVVALGEHVDYWDHQGWKDRFSSAALTSRQQIYAARFNLESIYTPQLVVDGRAEVVGSDGNAARRAIDRAAAAPHGRVQIAFDAADLTPPPGDAELGTTVTASELPPVGRGDRADIVFAIAEDGLTSNVTRGENHGRVLSHAAVVHHMTIIGEASAPVSTVRTHVTLEGEWQRDRLKLIAFVQERRGRAILASASANVVMTKRP